MIYPWDSILLGYDTATTGDWIPMFQDNVVPSSSEVLYPRKMECSATVLQKPQNSIWPLFCRFPRRRIIVTSQF